MSASEINSTTIKPTEYQPDEVMSAHDLRVILSQVMELNKSLQATVDRQTSTIAELTRELEWFRRNMFGKKSETAKRFEDYEDPDIHQLSLFDSMSDEQKLMLGIVDEKPKDGSLLLNVSLRDFKTSVYDYVKNGIIVDDWTEVCREKTDIEFLHLEKGLEEKDTKSIIDVVCSDCLKGYDSSQPIMFNPMGMGIFDIAIATYYYEKSIELGIGKDME